MDKEIDSLTRTIEAARHLFATQGFHQTAMSELATEAKVSVGQIYRLFKGKADIIEAIVENDSTNKLGDLAQICEAVRAGSLPIEQAFEKLSLMALSGNDEALSFEILSEAHRNPSVADHIGAMCGRWRPLLRDLARTANDRLSDKQDEAAEELLLACLFGLGHRSFSHPVLDVATTAKQTAAILLAGLRAIA